MSCCAPDKKRPRIYADIFAVQNKSVPTGENARLPLSLVPAFANCRQMWATRLNANSIVFVEPVGTDSKVAKLISEAGKQ